MAHDPGALFEDRAADARMRALIPRLAILGSLLVLVTAPLLAEDMERAVLVAATAVTALLLTGAVQRFRLLPRLPHWVLGGLLATYSALVATVSALTGGWQSPYALIQVIPLAFGAKFFPGRDAYRYAIVLWSAEQVVVGRSSGWSGSVAISRLAVFLLVAYFGVAVSAVLREAVESVQALHSVLEEASGDPLGAELASAGLDAALRVTKWDGGAVVIADGDRLPIVAIRGFGPEVGAYYAANPLSRGDGSMTAQVMDTGTIQYVHDAVAFLGSDNPVSRSGIVAVAGVPIVYHGEVIGVLILDTRRRRRFDDVAAGRLLRIGEQLGLALGSAQAHQREAQVIARLRDLNARKDEFLATISHELRTPVTSIQAAAQLLVDRGEQLTPAERAEIRQRQLARAGELTALIDSLLDEALAESGPMRLALSPMNLNAALVRWAATIERQRSRVIDLELPLLSVSIIVDPAKIERVVVNLLTNAVKFSEPGTPVTCRLDADGDDVRIAVIDHGPGISTSNLDLVFERFTQVDASTTRIHGGFGIGLALARRYAEAHGGRLTVHSELGVGSTFTLHLSRRALDALSARTAAQPDGDGPRHPVGTPL